MSASPQQVRQWSEEVAADPGSRAFLPLAEHYRAAGRHDAALRLVVRGLERHPYDVEAHHLLGLLYRDAGDLVRAEDEWGTAVALAPEHLAARRELGLFYYARGDWEQAVRHLDRARELDVMDDEVRLALEEAWARSREGGGRGRGRGDGGRGTGDSRQVVAETPAPAAPPASADAPAAPVSPAPPSDEARADAGAASPAPAPSDAAAPAGTTDSSSHFALRTSHFAPAAPTEAEPSTGGWQGGREFEVLAGELHALAGERGIVGAVMLDAQGFVVAGELHVGGRDRGPEIAAVLSPASFEAERSLRHLGLGSWRGILVETPEHVVRLSPTADGGMVAVAGSREVPTGWVLRVAGRAREAAERFLAALGSEGR
ncbi:MAG TPA: tetratricopeptide repeat protein [Longimicrobium sp.]|jgi:predicted regulator of Ras-like GTPase activity (Roadblock/LC7/MglB family)/cell division septation protein DedD